MRQMGTGNRLWGGKGLLQDHRAPAAERACLRLPPTGLRRAASGGGEDEEDSALGIINHRTAFAGMAAFQNRLETAEEAGQH